MQEGGLKEKRKYTRESINREAQHKAFVKSGEFDKLRFDEPLNVGDRVVIREKAAIGTVREVAATGDSVSIDFGEKGGDVVARVTRKTIDVRLAKDYGDALRKQKK